MNQKIELKESWGLTELQERDEEMISFDKKIWAQLETTFVPAEEEFDTCTLDDEDRDCTKQDDIRHTVYP